MIVKFSYPVTLTFDL